METESKEKINRLVVDLLSQDQKVVQPAIAKISRIGPGDPELVQELVPALLELLNLENPDDRMRGCWAFGQVGYKVPEQVRPAIPPLLERLSDPAAQVRAQAVWALGRIGRVDPYAIQEDLPDIMGMAVDPDASVRQNFLWASENFAASHPDWLEPYLPVFIRLLEDDDVRAVRRQAPEVFRIIAKQRPDMLNVAVPKLKKLLKDRDQIVRMNAGNALEGIQKGVLSLEQVELKTAVSE